MQENLLSSSSDESQQQVILNNTSLCCPSLVPELRLHLLKSDAEIWVGPDEVRLPETPYWGIAWGAGQALSRWILDHPELIAGKRIVDLGCGSGMCGIAAAIAGAASVLLVDIDPLAITAARMNAAVNKVVTTAVCSSFTDLELLDFDVVLASDVRHFDEQIMETLRQTSSGSQLVLAAEPDRRGTTLWPEETLATVEVRAEPSLEAFHVRHAVVAKLQSMRKE